MKATTVLKLVTILVLHLNQDYYQSYLYSILCLTRALLTLMSGISSLTSLVDKITVFIYWSSGLIKFLRHLKKVEIPELIRDD
jgi:hypothetical protein